MTQEEALRMALEALETSTDWDVSATGRQLKSMQAITALRTALAQTQEPVEVDQSTMELAESVGLIGPTSRTHDLHQAIQRFHDLICVNAAVKAAQMAADVIRESTPPQRTWVGLTAKEKHEIRYSHMTSAEFIEVIEAKLKEKNNG